MSIAPEMLKALDRAIRKVGFPSRSHALEATLDHWLAQHRQQQIERETEVYYQSLTAQEKREDREWAEFASRQVVRRKV